MSLRTGIRLACLLLLALGATACATRPSFEQHATIGPFPEVHGRLLVMTPSKRWQVQLDWYAERAEQGRLRLLHAASATIVEVEWQRPVIRLRDSRNPTWRRVAPAALAEQGILLPPWELAAILLGDLPADFRPQGGGRWDARRGQALLRLEWQAERSRLSLTDITHGRRIVLLIERP